MFLLISYFFQEAVSESQTGNKGRSMLFGSTGDSLLMVQAILFISCSTHQQAFSFQNLITLSGSRKVESNISEKTCLASKEKPGPETPYLLSDCPVSIIGEYIILYNMENI